MKILALSPHTDDVECGAGGFLASLAENHEIRVLCFSTGNPETGANREELKRSMKTMGIDDFICLDLETRQFPARRQYILDWLIAERDAFRPNLVLAPSSHDCHQDHQVVYAEAIRAYRLMSILGYELPWSNPQGFKPEFYVPLTLSHLQIKIKALAQYRSQWNRRYYLNKDAIDGLATMRGVQIGEQRAEAFEVMRWIWKE